MKQEVLESLKEQPRKWKIDESRVGELAGLYIQEKAKEDPSGASGYMERLEAFVPQEFRPMLPQTDSSPGIMVKPNLIQQIHYMAQDWGRMLDKAKKYEDINFDVFVHESNENAKDAAYYENEKLIHYTDRFTSRLSFWEALLGINTYIESDDDKIIFKPYDEIKKDVTFIKYHQILEVRDFRDPELKKLIVAAKEANNDAEKVSANEALSQYVQQKVEQRMNTLFDSAEKGVDELKLRIGRLEKQKQVTETTINEVEQLDNTIQTEQTERLLVLKRKLGEITEKLLVAKKTLELRIAEQQLERTEANKGYKSRMQYWQDRIIHNNKFRDIQQSRDFETKRGEDAIAQKEDAIAQKKLKTEKAKLETEKARLETEEQQALSNERQKHFSKQAELEAKEKSKINSTTSTERSTTKRRYREKRNGASN